MKKIVSVFLSFILLISLLPISQTASASEALSPEMKEMIEKGVITGYQDGTYKPFANVKREEFATFLYRALNLEEGEHVFKDVDKNAKLAVGINAAAAAGIVTGTKPGYFEPKKLINRQQMAIMIERALDYLQVPKKNGPITFLDKDKITHSSSVSRMIGHSIITGSQVEGGFVFKPQDPAKREHAAAFIARMLKAADDPGTDPEPPIETKPFVIGTVDSQGVVTPGNNKYKTFEEADKLFNSNSNNVILKDGKVIKMNKGIVVSKAYTAQNKAKETVVYTKSNQVYGPMEFGSEIEYVSSDESKIFVKVAGEDGYVKHTEAYLLPNQPMEKRTHYKVDANNKLIHYIYNHSTGETAQYDYGFGSSKMTPGTKYYSWDGQIFTDKNGNMVDTIYQYFNMLPFRTSTNYSAENLDAVIMSELKRVEARGIARYKNASTKSKLIGIGKQLKKMEKEQKINAFMSLTHALHESDYGMSDIAQKNNNIFGLTVHDSNPGGSEKYPSVEINIEAYIKGFLNKKYIPVGSSFAANGGHLGNKSRGVNVRYASDPYWGQKTAGHMLRLDTLMGGKDYVNNPSPYNIYKVNSFVGFVNVRQEADSKSKLLYKYPLGYVAAVVSTEVKNDYTWHKILSDSNEDLYAYVADGDKDGKYVTPLTFAK